MYLQLGENQASLTLKHLRKNFDFEYDSDDNALLDLVAQSLNFVKRIRPGDSIPTEVLDGTASWSVEARHTLLAKTRMTVALAQWIMGDTSAKLDARQIIEKAEDPEIKKRAKEGIDRLADENGFANQDRHIVVSMIDQLGDELSYIEALKEHLKIITSISDKLRQTQKTLKNDKGLSAEIDRIQVLIKEQLKKYGKAISRLNADTADVDTLIKFFDNKVNLIRATRDDLRGSFMDWEELVRDWSEQEIESDDRQYHDC